MAIRRSRSSITASKQNSQRRPAKRNETRRKMLLENLEPRQLLAIGPQLIGVQPNDGALLPFDRRDIRNVAPLDLTFRFDENQVFDPADLSGIQITRSNLDGQFAPASVQSEFNTFGAVRLGFTATRLGQDQNGIRIAVSKRDQGNAGPPAIAVVGTVINVSLNTNLGNETTALDLVNAINSDIDASALIRATILAGDPVTNIAAPPINYSPLTLTGANDLVVQPGFVGLGDFPYEIIVRFNEPLPDDVYRIDVFGEGKLALRNANGDAFNDTTDDGTDNGSNAKLEFELDLGALITAVVPQPVDRLANGTLQQRGNLIRVYFNNDDLDPATATDPVFYQLILTNDSVENTDDVVFHPTLVSYDPVADLVTLDFGANLYDLINPNTGLAIGAGTFRLRIGTDEVAPAPPLSANIQEAGLGDPGSSFETALSVGRSLQVLFGAGGFDEGDTFTVTDDGGTSRLFEFDFNGLPVNAGAELITLLPGQTAAEVALAVAGAINGSALSAQADALGSRVNLAGAAAVNLAVGTTGLRVNSLESLILSQEIVPTSILSQVYAIDFPGSNDEPGHRESVVEAHVGDDSADTTAGITTIQYNFRSDYGFDPFGNPLFNDITAAQKQRAREVFEMLSRVAGVQFVETARDGFTIVTGDMRALDPFIDVGPGGTTGLAGFNVDIGRPQAIMDNSEQWNDSFGGSWFQTAMHEIGHLLGLGHTYELPPGTIMGSDGSLLFDNPVEPVFPGDQDIVHLQHLYRPESKDIDLYRVDLTDSGIFTAETVAERQRDFSQPEDLLNTLISVYQAQFDELGNEIGRILIARNDDYYSDDSFLSLPLDPGTYYVGVTASGNNTFDPVLEDSGFYGVTQGSYELRLNFRPAANRAIVDADNPVDPNRPEITPTPIDGDADGVPGGVYNFWFRTAPPSSVAVPGQPRTIYVDKMAPAGGNGTLAQPFKFLPAALNVDANGVPLATPNPNAARAGDIVRVLGNPGADGNITTLADNQAYEIGFPTLGGPLQDGATLEIPKGVTMMVDANAIFKLRRARIGVGSSSPAPQRDRSAGALQILGTPNILGSGGTPLIDPATGLQIPGSVYFTSYNDEQTGLDTFPFLTSPLPGDWGGIVFRADIDGADQTRFSWDEEGIFLNYVNHANMRFGGGNVVIESVAQIVNPINIIDDRPTVSFNRITRSADAALSATPNSFEETNFHAPRHQGVPHTADYDRVGPDVHRNLLINNTINALFVRIQTPAGDNIRKLTVPARWDDADVVHVMQENLEIEGTPGGPFLELEQPNLDLVVLTPQLTGSLPSGTYNYRLVFVDANGNESRPSTPTANVTINSASGQRSVRLFNLLQTSGDFVARRLYRSQTNGSGPYELIAQINQTDTTYTDTGATEAPGAPFRGVLDEADFRLRPRFDARLAIDPSMIVKLDGARFQTGLGGDFLAEGQDGREIVLTSLSDDRYGAGGTFDTGALGPSQGTAGQWGGIFIAQHSTASIDHAVIAFGGGVTRIEGTFTAFNVLEIHQAETRVANSVFEFNARGFGGQGPANRFGRGFNEDATIFVRGAQPIIYSNTFRNNDAPAISINVNALNHHLNPDYGRSTGFIDRVEGYRDNQGPLVLDNRLSTQPELILAGALPNAIHGMVVRGETLTTQSVWDDTSIAHVLFDRIYIPDFHTYGGLRLESGPTESLVVKLDSRAGRLAGFEALGIPHEIDDRIGGIIQIIGQPKSPVVLTSIADDTHSAGFQPNGEPQNDTNVDGDFRAIATARRPAPGDWDTILMDRYSHDRNVSVVTETESRDENPPGENSTAIDAQFLGGLAPFEKSGDENLRLGFEVHGFLTSPQDLDVYSFDARALTEVWVDVDRTTFAADFVVELIDSNDNVLARSVNSRLESPLDRLPFETLSATNAALPMQKVPPFPGKDFWTVNPRDPGMRLILPGPVDTTNTYHIRIRSNSPDLDNLAGGLTSGAYQMQIRLRELDEVAGSVVRFANIGYATNGITILGQPIHSPLLGEVQEDPTPNDALANAQQLGNLLTMDRGTISIAGRLDFGTDVDWYQLTISPQDVAPSASGGVWPVMFDIDYADGVARPDTFISIFDADMNLVFTGFDSNVSDDRPAPLNGSDIDDLSRGTVGAKDGSIGPVFLPGAPTPGRPNGPTYWVAISQNSRRPVQLDQFSNPTPNNPLLRLEPITSLDRIAEDHIGIKGSVSVNDPVQQPNLLDGFSPVPWFLGDVQLFVARESFVGPENSALHAVNPFTGAWEVAINDDELSPNDPNANPPIPYDVGDIAMRSDGRVFTFSLDTDDTDIFAPQDSESGNVIVWDTGNGAALTTFVDAGATFSNLDDGILTFESNFAAPPAPQRAHLVNGNRVGYGIQFNAMHFGEINGPHQTAGVERLLAVGNRGELENFPSLDTGVPRRQNILYEFDASPLLPNGAVNPSFMRAIPNPGQARLDGAATDALEAGGFFPAIIVNPEIVTADATLITPPGCTTNCSTIFNVKDGYTFAIDDGFTQTVFEFDAGPEVEQNINPNLQSTIRDGYFFQLDPNSAVAGDERTFQFDTGTVINFTDFSLQDNTLVTIQDDTGGTAFTFEFDNDGVQNTPGTIVYTGATLTQRAGNLATLINATAGVAQNMYTVQAAAVGTRVTLTNSTFTELFPINATGVRLEGETGEAPIMQMVSGDQLVDGQTLLFLARADSTPILFEFDTDPAPGSVTPGAVRVPFSQFDILKIPRDGGNNFFNQGVQDGDTFTVFIPDDGVDPPEPVLTFEFDNNNNWTGDVRIPFGVLTSQAVLAQATVDAINNSPLAERTALGLSSRIISAGRLEVRTDPTAMVTLGPPGTNLVFSPFTADEMAVSLHTAVQLQGANFPVTSQLAGDKVVINGPFIRQAGGTALPIRKVNVDRFIAVEENMFNNEVAPRVVVAVNSVTGFTAGTNSADGATLLPDLGGIQGGGRINFLGAETGDFRGVPAPIWVPGRDFDGLISQGGVKPGNVAIPFLASDLANDYPFGTPPVIMDGIATRITDAINNLPNVNFSAATVFDTVQVFDGTPVLTQPSPFRSQGAGPGGNITGLTDIGGQLYAVSDQGGLWAIDVDLRAPNPRITDVRYIQSSAEDLLGINFQALTQGPQTVEGGRYANLMFGMDEDGTLFAFNTAGVLQPIFVDGRTSVETGIPNVRGIDFSTLDQNLFHQTNPRPFVRGSTRMDVRVGITQFPNTQITVDERQLDAGHLITPPDVPDSYHFGQGHVGGMPRSIDFPGGAHGTLVSNEFSLKGYSPQDRPTFYFTYFSANENDADVYDAFRVFITDNSGNWQLLASNIDNDPGQRIHDNSGTWRQVRVPLDAFAGFENLRLRFDFSTAGDMNVGDTFTTGTELRAVAGIFLRDGDVFAIDSNNNGTVDPSERFEFESGYTIIPPSAATIPDGETISITDRNGLTVTFEFDKEGRFFQDIQTFHGARFQDGQTFTLDDDGPGPNPPVLFEMDSGFTLNVPDTLALIVPGAGGRDIADDETFTINAGTNPFVFEFDRNGSGSTVMGSIVIPYLQTDSRETIADAIVAAILSEPLLFLTPVHTGEGNILLGSNANHTIDGFDAGLIESSLLQAGLTLHVPAGGALDLFDNESFVVDPDGPSGPAGSQTFELDLDGSGATVAGNVAITVNAGDTADDIAVAIANTLNATFFAEDPMAENLGKGTVLVRGTGRWWADTTNTRVNRGAAIGDIEDGERFTIDNGLGTQATFEYDRDGTVGMGNTRIDIAGELVILVPEGGGGTNGVFDGNTFTLGDGSGPGPRVFEFNRQGNMTFNPLNAIITFTTFDTQATLADKIVAAIQTEFPALTPVHSGDGRIVLNGTTSNYSLNTGGTPNLGQTHRLLPQYEIAERTEQAVLLAGLGLAPLNTGRGNVHLGGTTTLTVDVSMAANVTVSGQPGTNNPAPPAVRVPFIPDADTFNADQMAVAIAAAINGAPLSVIATPVGDVVEITGSQTAFDPGTTPLQPVAVNPVFIQDAQTAADVARLLATAISGSALGTTVPLHLTGERLNLGGVFNAIGATDVTRGAAPGAPAPTVNLQGQFGLNDPLNFPNNNLVYVNEGMTRIQVANEIDRLLEAHFITPQIVAANSFAFDDEDTFVLDDGLNPPVTFEFESDFILTVPAAGADPLIGIRDGDTITFTDQSGAPSLTFELDEDGFLSDPINHVGITFAGTDGASGLAQKIAAGINASFRPERFTLGLNAVLLSGGRVQVLANDGVTILLDSISPPSNLTVAGAPGITDPMHIQVPFRPSLDFGSDSIAIAIRNAINQADALGLLDITASISPNAQRNVRLNRQAPGIPSDITFTPDADGDLRLDAASAMLAGGGDFDLIKQDGDLLRIIGHRVLLAGPLGADVSLQEDPPPPNPPFPVGYDSPRRGQNNIHEGIYIDDLIIGFAERGERVLDGTTNEAFSGAPSIVEIPVGEYQLEIRLADELTEPRPITKLEAVSLDTNDRNNQSLTLVAQAGANLADGETFILTDGVNQVTFEYHDVQRIESPRVTPGNVEIQFDSTSPDWLIARRIRNAINSSTVQSRLKIVAGLSDGTDGIVNPDLPFPNGTDNKVNLYGPARLVPDSNLDRVTIAERVPNDTIADAFATGIVNRNSPSFQATGIVGDNPNFPLQPGFDVDVFELSLVAGQTVRLDIDAKQIGSTLDSVLRIFNSSGVTVAQNDDASAPGEQPSVDSFVQFTPQFTGTYYVGVSGFGNASYNPFVEGSGAPGSTGFYELDITFGVASQTDYIVFDRKGDGNLFRDQGQLIVEANRISNSLEWGIRVDSGMRDGPDGNPHQGPVRQLGELNDSINPPEDLGLAPGVVIANNLVHGGGTGGILFSGLMNGPTEQQAAVAFGRIYNNTVFGVGGDLLLPNPNGVQDIGIRVEENSSPTLLNNIVANFFSGLEVDFSSRSTVVGGQLYQGNLLPSNVAVEDFPIFLANGDPLFVNPGNENFFLEPTSQAIDSSIDSLEERFIMNIVREPLGIAPSPIKAPNIDVTGQLRVDDPDVETPAGLGENVFVDRGAIDRADFVGPTALLIRPRDNDADGIDQDGSLTVVELPGSAILSNFEIRLVDGVEPADPSEGVGVDDLTVTTDTVVVTRDGILLRDGIDYRFTYNTTSDTIRLTPLSGIWRQDSIYVITLNNSDSFRISLPHGSVINDGDSFRITDQQNVDTIFEFESGYELRVLQTLAIQVPAQGGGLGGITDAETFSVSNGAQLIRFEFDRTSLGNGFDPNHVPIPFGVEDTADTLAARIRDVLAISGLGLQPKTLPGGVVHLGATNLHTLDTSLSQLTTLGAPNVAINDEDLFSIDDGSRYVVFEFNSDGMLSDLNNVGIDFTPGNTHEEIANFIIDAIRAQNLGLSPRDLGDGRIYVGGEIRHILETSLVNTTLQQSGRPGVSPSFGIQIPTRAGVPFGIMDGETFTIRDGVNPQVQFELNNLDVDPRVTLGNVRIDFLNSSTTEEIAESIRLAILGAGVGLNPVYQGDGIIDLQGATGAYVINLDDTVLTQRGSPGVPAAVAVPVTPVPEFDASQVAVAVIRAINAQPPDSPTLLTGVQARPAGGGDVVITGAQLVTDINNRFVANVFTGAIKDLALNDLKSNQLSGETQFTILVGQVNMDFGDAPAGPYPTNRGGNGAIHVITSDPLYLGRRVDRELNGQPSVDAQGDDIDGDNVPLTTASPGLTLSSAVTPADLQVNVAAISDGQTFMIGGATFEFDNDDAVIVGNFRVPLGTTNDAVADAIVAAIIEANLRLNLNPINEGGGRVSLDGDDDDGVRFLDPFNAFVQTRVEFTATADDATIAGLSQNIALAAGGSGPALAALLELGLDPVALNSLTPQQQFTTVSNAIALEALQFDRNRLTVATFGKPLGLVDGWVDFNRDGDFNDAGEQVFASQQLAAGRNEFTIQTPPATSVVGLTLARFRYSSTGGLTPTGLFADGEVEDYVIDILPGSPPTARDDMFAVDEDTLLRDNVLTNDDDPDGDPFEVNGFQNPSTLGATVVVSPGGSFDYDPRTSPVLQALAVNDTAMDTFTYTITDNISGSSTATVTVTVAGRNDRPVANPLMVSVTDGDSIASQPFDADDVDSDDNPATLVYTIVDTLPGLTNNGDGTFTFNTLNNFQDLGVGQSRNVTFTYRVTDSHGEDSDLATVTITVIGVNDPPIARNVTRNAFEDGGLVGGQFDGDDVDLDDDRTTLLYTIVDNLAPTGEGSVTNNNDGSFTFNPGGDFQQLAEGQVTSVDFTYQATDRHGATSNVATVTVNVTGINDTPVASNLTVTITENDTLRRAFPADDADSDDSTATLQYTIISGLLPGEGTLIRNSDGTFTFNPGADFQDLTFGQSRTVDFTFKATDRHLAESNIRTVTIIVEGRNDAPVAQNVAISAVEDGPVVFGNFNANDADSDDSPATLQYTITNLPSEGLVGNNDDGTFTFDPSDDFQDLAQGQTRQVTFTYIATDRHNVDSNEATVTVTVTGVNDAPTAVDDLVQVFRNGDIDIPVLANDFDVDGTIIPGTLAIVPGQGPSNGTVSINPDGSIRYSPSDNFTGFDTFRYTVRDNLNATSNQATVTVRTVIPWQNPENRLDVWPEGVVSPRDVLIIFNYINANGAGPLPIPTPQFEPPPFYDVTGDNILAPNDALPIINFLNGQVGGEGEAADPASSGGTDWLVQPWLLGGSLDAGLFSRVADGGGLSNELLADQAGPRRQLEVTGVGVVDPSVEQRQRARQSALAALELEDALWDDALDSLIDDLVGQRSATEDDLLFGDL
ncbi:MAG: DVUA0089 family protein [Pirellulaceae bacterium]|nr:DVUA0089 family protein [Pirellulaceae bacterium]